MLKTGNMNEQSYSQNSLNSPAPLSNHAIQIHSEAEQSDKFDLDQIQAISIVVQQPEVRRITSTKAANIKYSNTESNLGSSSPIYKTTNSSNLLLQQQYSKITSQQIKHNKQLQSSNLVPALKKVIQNSQTLKLRQQNNQKPIIQQQRMHTQNKRVHGVNENQNYTKPTHVQFLENDQSLHRKQNQNSLQCQQIANEDLLDANQIKLSNLNLQQFQQQDKYQQSEISNFDEIPINRNIFDCPSSPQSRLTIRRGSEQEPERSVKNQQNKSFNFETITTAGSVLSVNQKAKKPISKKNLFPLQQINFDQNYLRKLNQKKKNNNKSSQQRFVDKQSCQVESESGQEIEQDCQSCDEEYQAQKQQINVENIRFGLAHAQQMRQSRAFTTPYNNNLMPKGNHALIPNHFPNLDAQAGRYNLNQRRATVVIENTDNIGFRMRGQANNRVVSPQQFKEGFLQKKAHTRIVGYQTRWVVVAERKLKYYKKQTKGGKKGQYTRLRGVIDFDLLSCKLFVEEGSKPIRFSIDILANKRSFRFRATNYQQLSTWVRAINAQIERSKGDDCDLTKVAIQKQFWRYNRCTQKQFIKGATTGDILLFQGKSFTSKFQRVITRSPYDHVALLLKYKNGKLSLFEATGQCGVEVLQWSDFMRNKWHLLYPKLVWRKLYNFERKPEILRSLQSFVKNSRGKKYKITTKKLMKKKNQNDFGEQVQDNRSFFCSQLVASAFKLMGLLPKQKSCTQYWPGSFAARNNLKLQGNAQFSEQLLIDFTL